MWFNARVRNQTLALAVALTVSLSLPLAGCGVGARSVHGALGAPRFVEEASAAGIDHTYSGGFEYFVGGGVAVFDCNADGRPDLYLAGGADPAALYVNQSAVGTALRFGRKASAVTDLTAVTGAYPIDIDSDGVIDLMVLRRGANVLLRGLGDCRFEVANDRFGLDGGHGWTTAFSATWEASNSLPTLAVGNYLIGDSYDCDRNELVRPATSGTGYAAPTPLAPGYCALSMLFSDWNRSGHSDLRVTNDRHYYGSAGQEQLWHMAPAEQPRQYTDAEGWRPLQIEGMGIASRDLNGDGYPELFLTSQADNKLQALDSAGDAKAAGGASRPVRPSYRDIALHSGVTAQRPFTGGDILPSTAWHPEFDDVNNDGFVDLFVSKGNVDAQPDQARDDPSNLFLGRSDGTFREGATAAGIVSFDKARGAALVDLNLDGMLDLVVVNRDTNVKLWRNVGTGDATTPVRMGHWLAVKLTQPAPNVDAIGSWLDVRVGGRTVQREVTIGGGHASGQLGWLHTGLGTATSAEVRVHWPSGDVGPWLPVATDQFVTIDRGAATATPWVPGSVGP